VGKLLFFSKQVYAAALFLSGTVPVPPSSSLLTEGERERGRKNTICIRVAPGGPCEAGIPLRLAWGRGQQKWAEMRSAGGEKRKGD